jgi:hypothetical protein
MIPLRRASALLSLTFCLAFVAAAQQGTVYTATVIPAVAQSGGTTKVRIQISSWTTAAERTELKQAFANGQEKGIAFLRSMTKGYINIGGQSGRKIFAAFTIESPNGKRLVIVTEHVLSQYEKTQKVHAEDYPLTFTKIQFDAMGHPESGQVYPAARVSVTADGFVDVATQDQNIATMIDIVREN